MYAITRKFIKILVCNILFRVKYENLDILEKYDKCIICPNHSRIFDPIFLYPKINNMYSVAKSDAFKNKFLAHFLKYHNVIPINRNYADVNGVKNIINVINKNDKIRLLIFPEGGIFKENYKENKRKVKNGAVYISAITNTPIIPINITPRPAFFSKVTVSFMDPFTVTKEVLNDKKILKEKSKKLIHIIYKD